MSNCRHVNGLVRLFILGNARSKSETVGKTRYKVGNFVLPDVII